MNAYQQGFNEKCMEYGLIKSALSIRDAVIAVKRVLLSGSKSVNRELLGLNDVKGFGKTMAGKGTLSKVNGDWPKSPDAINDLPMSPGIKRIIR